MKRWQRVFYVSISTTSLLSTIWISFIALDVQHLGTSWLSVIHLSAVALAINLSVIWSIICNTAVFLVGIGRFRDTTVGETSTDE